MIWLPVISRSRLAGFFSALLAVAALPPCAQAQDQRPAGARLPERDAPIEATADRMVGRPDQDVTLDNNVELKRGATTITADHAHYDVVKDQVDANGNIVMRRFGDRYTGDELQLKLDAGEGYVLNPTYKRERNNAQGNATRIDFESEDRVKITDGTYSTCEGPDPDWYLQSDTMNLDNSRDIGTASKTILYFKGVPILGTPAMSFPLSNARKSGVLAPSIGTTSKGGLEISVPYYFNIAPNYDLTLFPNLIARRGIQLGAEGRYMTERVVGQTRFEILPNDRQTGTTRYALASTHTQYLTPRLGFNWNINSASDDDYPSDFSRSITNSSQRLLLRDFNLNYAGSFWNVNARASNYQVLQDVAAPIARPYNRLPQITLNAGQQDIQVFDWTLNAEATRFWHPDLVRGNRFVINPRLTYPITRAGAFITPALSLHATRYTLENQTPGAPTNLTRTLPTFSLDSGLIFERDARIFGQTLRQTLEPRLFYVYTPYRDQSQLPNFDSAEADLSFSQLFSENRFVGNDRISDANQLTTALISRFYENSGAERFRLAVGQRFYFSDQRITLGTALNDSRSDLLLSLGGSILPALNVEANLQYSESSRSLNRANYGVRWQPAPKRVLNFQYRRDVPNALEQVDLSGQWPIARRWYAVGRVNYSLPERKVAEGLAGAEYKADCWIFRAVAQRIPTATGRATSSVFLQLELTGLTRLGSNPLDALRSSIPGYQLLTQPPTP